MINVCNLESFIPGINCHLHKGIYIKGFVYELPHKQLKELRPSILGS